MDTPNTNGTTNDRGSAVDSVYTTIDPVGQFDGLHRTLSSANDSVDHWLKTLGLEHDPFRLPYSELDFHLDEYYCEHEQFAANLAPDHSVLYAKSGAGKTAARKQIEAHFQSAFRLEHVLAVPYLVPEHIADAPPVSLSGHIPELAKALVLSAFVALAQHGNDFPNLDQDNASRLAWYVELCYPLHGTWQDDLTQAITERSLGQMLRSIGQLHDPNLPPAMAGTVNADWLMRWKAWCATTNSPPSIPSVTNYQNLTEQHWDDILHLLKQIGIPKLIILVDGVDGKTGRHRINRMNRVTQPFVDAILQGNLGPDTFCKLFLPLEIEPFVAHKLGKRIPMFRIQWGHASLRELITRRLAQASGDMVRSLRQLIEPAVNDSFNLEEHLIEQSAFLPRTLIHSIERLFAIHATQLSESQPATKISFASVEALLQQYNTNSHFGFVRPSP